MPDRNPVESGNEPTWFKDAIIYQLHVKSFFDSNGDGIGDFQGLAQKMDYLQDLGVTAVWLLPFYPSPLRDDGYDIADYTRVNPSFGTMADFRSFLREAHRRDLKVITELVINHTSDQHEWFQRARNAPKGSPARDFYVWSDTTDRYQDARIIFQDFEPSNWSWDPVAQQYYWHRFYSHQPDLNFENPAVRKAVKDAMDFWLKMGVDGLRLDAIPYLFEEDGTNCENLPQTHEFLQELRAHLDERFDDRMLLAEANQWPEDAVAYFGDGNECHMSFHFPLMPRLFMALQSEDRFPIHDILQQTPSIPESCQWAIFLRNHDELTLEMVTDEERDYMYRAYATDPQMRINLGIRRRLAPLLGGNRRKIELLNGLLFSMPGTPIVYYGDELGMGDNVYLGDRDGVRTPMQWSADRNAGFSRAHPHRLFLPAIIDPEYHYEYINVESQQNNSSWLLWWMKRLIGLRKQHPAFGRGTMEMLLPDNNRVLTYIRRFEGETILVAANLSRFSQAVELDLSEFAGATPLELFGHSQFPVIGDEPYFLSLGPHAFHWFVLESSQVGVAGSTGAQLPELTVRGPWSRIVEGQRPALKRVLQDMLQTRRWFGAKNRRVSDTQVLDAVPIGDDARIVLVRVEYFDGEAETYLVPIRYLPADLGDEGAALLRVRSSEGEGFIVDAVAHEDVQRALLELVARRRTWKGTKGSIGGVALPGFSSRLSADLDELPSRAFPGEQSNSSVLYGNRWIMKVYRRLYVGENPDLELSRYLSETRKFPHTPRTAGFIEYRPALGSPSTVAIVQEQVENSGDAWQLTVDELGRFFERIITSEQDEQLLRLQPAADHLPADVVAPPEVHEQIGPYLEWAALLGTRTGEMHNALGHQTRDEAYSPEPFSQLYQRSLYQQVRSDVQRAMQSLRRWQRNHEPGPQVQQLLELEPVLLERARQVARGRMAGARIRIHGDYHLGQVLYTGRDFVIIDFEGEPARPLSERRIKRSPLRDVAGMLRSFHYAAFAHLTLPDFGAWVRPEDAETLVPWADWWYRWVTGTYLNAYLAEMAGSELLPSDPAEIEILLDSLLLQKAMYEIGYELQSRPDWLAIPVRGALELARNEDARDG